ncbi:MAG: class I SAM-dependent methyltransferase [Planctomycetota bacterium]|jgi:SAM-dependent methyltransferase
MTMEVLQNRLQISQSRNELTDRGISFIDSPIKALVRKTGFLPGIAVGDWLKSWDVLTTIDFLEHHVQKNEPILDIGCYASEVIVVLYRLGYSSLTGIDLNLDLRKMPYQKTLHYEIADFMNTKFVDSSFQAITSISVIEHGFNGPSLLKEMSRLLKPDGYFIASFDYWPEKIDTTGQNFFGMDWRIFSEDEISDFINEAAAYNLFPVDMVNYTSRDKVIDYWENQYTFAWLALEKKI